MNMTHSIRLTTLLVIFALQPAALAQDSIDASLKQCAAIADDSARLDCFDALAGLRGNGVPAAPVVLPVQESGPVPLTDDVGKERIEEPDVAEQPRFTARVTSCRKNPQSGQYSFAFDNGQVWKQSTYRSLSMRNCDFDVEIRRVPFGYDMYIPSKDRSVRIKRVR